jgi:Tol biopolymer transport system component
MSSSTDARREAGRRRLDAWKAIAQYLGRDVTTVRRWEKRERLPVHRHLHAKLGSVYAFTDEIDSWWQRRSQFLDSKPAVMSEGSAPDAHDSTAVSLAGPPNLRSHVWSTGVGLSLLLIAIAAVTGGRLTSPGEIPEPMVRLALAPPPGVVIESLAAAPDGQRMAFSGRASTITIDLWVQALDSPAADRLSGTAGARFPFWSPDSQHIGYFADGRLKSIALATRTIRDLAPAPSGLGGAWNSRDEIVFAPDRGAGLLRVSTVSGEISTVTTVEPTFHTGHAWPEFLPGDRYLLYTDYGTGFGVYVHDLTTGKSKRLLPVFSRASYSSDGFLLFVKGSLMAQRFDLATLTVAGKPVAIAGRVLQWGDLAYHADFSVSRTGLVLARVAADERNKLVWIDRKTGRTTGQIGNIGYYSNPTLSPDGRTLAVTMQDESMHHDRISLFDTATGEGRPFTEGPIVDFAPLWSAQGDRLFFSSVGKQGVGLFERSVAGGGDKPLRTPPSFDSFESASRDGKVMTFGTLSTTTKTDVWAWRRGEDEAPFPVLNSTANEGHSRLSPNGRFLAYASDESGRFEVYVRPLRDPTKAWRVSNGGGADPLWSPDGRELSYVADDRQMMVAPISTQPLLRAGVPVRIFDTALEQLWMDTRNHYDVTPDGRRFVLLAPATDRRASPFTVLVNWRQLATTSVTARR